MSSTRSGVATALVFVVAAQFVSFPFAFAQTGAPATGAAASGASAPAGATEEAATRYARGIELYKEENYKAALVEFRKAYELTHAYKVLYNIGQVCYQLQDYVCAVSSFEGYLKDGGNEIAVKRRMDVEADLKKLRPRIAEVKVETNVPDVDITIDDVPYGKTPLEPIRLNAGSHRVTAVKEGKVPVTQSFDVAGADKPTLKITLVDAGGKQVVVQQGPQSKWTTLSYIGLGTAGALAIGAGVTGVLALSSSSDLKNQRYVGEPSDDARSLQSKTKTLRLTSDILTVGAAVTLGATLFFTLTRNPEGTPPKTGATGIGVGLGSVSIHGVF